MPLTLLSFWALSTGCRPRTGQFTSQLGKCPIASIACLNACCRLRHASATRGTVTFRAPLSMGVSRQGYRTGLPCSPPGELPDPGIKHASRICLLLWQEGSSPLSHQASPLLAHRSLIFGHPGPGLGQHNFQGLGLPCSYLGLTSTLFPRVSLLVFFFFLSPHNISLQMSHFRELFVFRKTHSSVLMKLEVKM